jgi:hypothetical protein
MMKEALCKGEQRHLSMSNPALNYGNVLFAKRLRLSTAVFFFVLVAIGQHMSSVSYLRQSRVNCNELVPDAASFDEENSGSGYALQPRILIYITSHMSASHEEFLHRCWPYVLSNSKLVQMADIKVFLNGEVERQNADAEVFRYVFHEKVKQNRLSIHQVENEGYQEGAIAAMAMAHKHGWFEGYDWVVRVNPDVIIRNDTWILETIMNSEEENVAGIFVDCEWKCNQTKHCESEGYRIHSDFTAFKPTALSQTTSWNESDNAETLNQIVFSSTVANGQDRWLVDSIPDLKSICRLSENDDASVTHYGDHSNGNALRCVEWYKERNLPLASSL